MSGCVIVTDSTDTITVANRAAAHLLGYAEGELIGAHISRVIPNPIGSNSRNQPMSWQRRDGARLRERVRILSGARSAA